MKANQVNPALPFNELNLFQKYKSICLMWERVIVTSLVHLHAMQLYKLYNYISQNTCSLHF